jgi:NAD(P)-dependent dehydrogenase (short-subunit alcohol dehydrogenase family)
MFITSVSAEMASVNRGDYCVSKTGLSMAGRLYAARLAEHGIPLYEVRPGIIATDMTAAVHETYDRRIADGLLPARRWGVLRGITKRRNLDLPPSPISPTASARSLPKPTCLVMPPVDVRRSWGPLWLLTRVSPRHGAQKRA